MGGLWVGEMLGSELQVCQAEKHIGGALNDWSALPFVTHQTLGLVWRMCTQGYVVVGLCIPLTCPCA